MDGYREGVVRAKALDFFFLGGAVASLFSFHEAPPTKRSERKNTK